MKTNRIIPYLFVVCTFLLLNGCGNEAVEPTQEECGDAVDDIELARAAFFKTPTTEMCRRVINAYNTLIDMECPTEDEIELKEERDSFEKSFCP